MKKISVNTSQKYDIFIEKGLLSNCAEIIKSQTKSKKFAIITDDIVDSLYSEILINSLTHEGFTAVKYVFKNGESSKSIENLNNIYSFLAKENITRSDCIIALGGGVVGDITGFAAATFLRGLDYIQIPTTLLAQIDSSVGGKTAINLTVGKNLVGSFKQPILVICDSNVLSTLSEEILADGMAEAIKYGMIRSSSLFDLINNHNIDTVSNVLDDIIYECISIKSDVVSADEFDKGERMILNFGHTLGHAVESYYNYEKYSHGSAVAIGMALITKQAVASSLCEKIYLEKLIECIEKYRLPVKCSASLNELVPLCYNDKKRESDKINIILCSKIGDCEIKQLTIENFNLFMEV